MKCIVFLGIQGSGKGTQAKLLSDRLGYQHINTGDLFREQIGRRSALGERVKASIGRGELVSDELVFEIIDSSVLPDMKGIVFDGFPRNTKQAEFLVRNYQVLCVFYLDLSEEDAIKRLSSRRMCSDCGVNFNLISHPPKSDGVCDVCGGELVTRQDDKPEAIKQRMSEFYQQTFELKDYFEARCLLKSVKAESGITEIATEINAALNQEF
ncbi:MAG: nucleoside monophosphate kinase [Candidatus Cloacimonadaceae bacterium]|nr:nucleoside monophosphate kinase [Candidatus Cloacimonadaceae bacterium]MDP3114275.1 nucleoside monophosphate kinase [Candidatus Cloacimonadaceae bacterium]